MLKKLWKDDAGIVALEYLLVATLIGLSLIVGLHAVSASLNSELAELGNAIANINQTYSYCGQSVCCASIQGGATTDAPGNTDYASIQPTASIITESPCP